MKMDESEEKGGVSRTASGKQPSSVDLASKLSENQSEKQVLGKSTLPPNPWVPGTAACGRTDFKWLWSLLIQRGW